MEPRTGNERETEGNGVGSRFCFAPNPPIQQKRDPTPFLVPLAQVGDETLYPDATFMLQGRGWPRLNFYVELDNGSERVRSSKDQDSIERKIRLYDQHETASEERHRVLFVCTRSQELEVAIDSERRS